MTDEFADWWATLDADQQAPLGVRIDLLESRGPDLGRPSVDRIKGSRHHNMKELRASEGGVLRVLFAFDPRRQAILLLGGDKSGHGPSGTSGRSRLLMFSTTSTWMSSVRRG